MKIRSLFSLLYSGSLFLIGPQIVFAHSDSSQVDSTAREEIAQDPLNSKHHDEDRSDEEIASGHMSRRGSHSGGHSGHSQRSGGGIHIRGSGSPSPVPHYGPSPQTPIYYPQPGSPIYEGEPPIYTDEMPEEPEEPEEPLSELPTFTLTNQTPKVKIGDTITVSISTADGQKPATIYWRYDGDPWSIGDTTFQHTATKMGFIPISVIIEDADGLYSQSQTTETEVTPGQERGKKYFEQGTNPPESPSPQAPPSAAPPEDAKPKKPKNPTDETEDTLELFGLDKTFKHQRARLNSQLEEAQLYLLRWESYLHRDQAQLTQCEAEEVAAIQKRTSPDAPPTTEEKEATACVKLYHILINHDNKVIESTLQEISEINKALK